MRATPVDLATSDGENIMTGVAKSNGSQLEAWPKQRVRVGALLSGWETIAVAGANHIATSKPDSLAIHPDRDVTITVELPDFLANIIGLRSHRSRFSDRAMSGRKQNGEDPDGRDSIWPCICVVAKLDVNELKLFEAACPASGNIHKTNKKAYFRPARIFPFWLCRRLIYRLRISNAMPACRYV